MVFEYDRVIEIADRLESLGIPRQTIEKIRAWADEKQKGVPLPKTTFDRPITNFVPRFVHERLFDICPDCGEVLTGGYRHDMCPICMADFTQSVAWKKAYRELMFK